MNQAFELTARTSQGLECRPSEWIPKRFPNTAWVVQGEVGGEWREIVMEFVPQGSGEILIRLCGEVPDGAQEESDGIWVDDLWAENLMLPNPGLEVIDGGLRIRDWGMYSRVSRDGTEARSGMSCIRLQNREALSVFTQVEEGRVYRVGAWFRGDSGR
ncbi:MAG: hypothetical protein JW937_05875 [Candidatus Omnitrophica bacterium]|nr:hypothetical protein [Candidatus Omnitrophota bacterium]